MADDQQVSPAPVVSAAPVVAESPVSVPIIDAAAASAIPETDSSAPVVETVTENVLGDSAKPEVAPDIAASPVEEKPEAKDPVKPETKTPADGEVKPDEEVKPELPVYEEFKIPEGVNLDKEQIGEFTKLLGEIETGKLDHAGMQEAGQKLIDLATKATADSITRLNDYYVQFHENQKKEWFESFKKDPEMGGENLDKTVSTLREAVEQYAGNETQIAEFRSVMKDTGVGNHPAVIRILNNMAQKIQKYTTEADNGNGGSNRIVPGQRPAPSKVKDYQRFYAGGNS